MARSVLGTALAAIGALISPMFSAEAACGGGAGGEAAATASAAARARDAGSERSAAPEVADRLIEATPGPPPLQFREPPERVEIDIGPGSVRAWTSDGERVALCLEHDSARLVLARPAAREATRIPWPLDATAVCDYVVLTPDRICVAGYDAGAACVGASGEGVATFDVPAPPTGLAWDGEALWIATDGGGLWKVEDDVPTRILDLADLMSGIVGGSFGVVWGTAGEYSWRTRTLTRSSDRPRWIRPRPPPGVVCADEPESCEWISTAVGVHEGYVYFTAQQSWAPLYRMRLEDGWFDELQVAGDVWVGPCGVVAADFDGTLRMLDESTRAVPPDQLVDDPDVGSRTWSAYVPPPVFVDTGFRIEPGAVPVLTTDGVWAAHDGVLRLVFVL